MYTQYTARFPSFLFIKLHVQGSNVNAQNKVGNTPLHRAARKGFFDVCFALLALGADAYLTSQSGKTALVLAEQAQHRGIVDLLKTPPRLEIPEATQ
eukprot:m.198359 g.198359  ORF g.198359 m.198359 type:complete len:97 (+) comp16835_c0_seq16:712-1002(+)